MSEAFAGYPAPVTALEDPVTSTSDLARAALLDGAPHGAAYLARAQTQGRGRHGRRWHSPPGDHLYLSMVVRPRLGASELAQLTLAAGVAAAEALAETCGLDVRLKWPNDLMLDGRKLGGILSEAVSDRGQLAGVVVGLGVNLGGAAADFPPPLQATVTTVSEARQRRALPPLPPGARDRLARAVLDRARTLLAVDAPLLIGVRARWRALAWLPQPVRLADGTRGQAVDLDETGALRVERARGGTVSVRSGELLWEALEAGDAAPDAEAGDAAPDAEAGDAAPTPEPGDALPR